MKWKTNIGDETTNMRGVALGKGLAFTISGTNTVYALSQKTGAVVWQKQLLIEDQGDPDCDPESGQCGGTKGSLAGAVVYWDGLIYVGTQGSTAGARGRGYAIHADTGELAWTFWGTPGPGEFGHDTWEGDTWKTGGAVCWIHPAVDPELGIVYWTFGNPYPRTDGSTRGGDNLFANCLVAIDAKSGKRRWHFQSVHHDIWDYDGVMSPVLADLLIDGRKRKVVVYGSKTGMYYILDRATGKPVHGMEERPVPQHARAEDGSHPAVPRRRAVRRDRAPARQDHPAGSLLRHRRCLHRPLGPSHHHLPRRGGRRGLVLPLLQPSHGSGLRRLRPRQLGLFQHP